MSIIESADKKTKPILDNIIDYRFLFSLKEEL
jgi:hypothetical protein